MVIRELAIEWGAVLAALYLPGTPHGVGLSRRRWPAVLGALRATECKARDAAALLRAKGHFHEAIALETSGALLFGETVRLADRVLTPLDDAYPERWRSVLGETAPPALWWMAGPPLEAPVGPWLGMVGSRQIEPAVHRFCADVAREAVRLGLGVASGGADGCDISSLRAASAGGGRTLVLLPYGLELFDSPVEPGALILSACAPDEPFSAARAMERNALIYAAGSHAFIGHSRFREGGTWTGATEAIRRRLTQTIVRKDEDAAHRALVSLGAFELESPEGLGEALARPAAQGAFRMMADV